MNDADRVAAIERRHELALLDRLLEEKRRPVPPPPAWPQPYDPTVKNLLIDLMLLIACELDPEDYPRVWTAPNVVDIRGVAHQYSTATYRETPRPSTRSPHANRRSLIA